MSSATLAVHGAVFALGVPSAAPSPYHGATSVHPYCPLRTLTLSRPLATRLLFEAQKSPDAEVCGFVSARDGRPHDLYPIDNVAADPARRFEMDPRQQIATMKAMRERGETMLAIYHSHPATPPEPSVHDIEGLGYPDALVLIISLNIKGVLEMRAWQRDDGSMREVPLTATG